MSKLKDILNAGKKIVTSKPVKVAGIVGGAYLGALTGAQIYASHKQRQWDKLTPKQQKNKMDKIKKEDKKELEFIKTHDPKIGITGTKWIKRR